jgi:thioredoxin reductase (NADPH)
MTPTDYDVIIVGAGSTGLAAAVYTGREGLKTAVFEADIAGGLIATTELVDNLPGFPDGIGGIEIADRLLRHAKRFGAEVLTNYKVTSINRGEYGLSVQTTKGPKTARAVLVATGAHYRHLDVSGEQELTGRGVHYCATCDGPLYRGKELIVVGGGNTALQEGLFLAKFASKLTFLVRGPKFKGSQILIDRLAALPSATIRFDTEVVGIGAQDKMFADVTTRAKPGGQEESLAADGLFVFAGLIPNTEFLADALKRDERGFIMIDRRFQTSLPGVYAAGDVCQGATGQVATAIGDGVAAALEIRHFLESTPK